jgi:hypothetical protein
VMTAAAKMPVGLWVRLMARLWLIMRIRIARVLLWLLKTLRL